MVFANAMFLALIFLFAVLPYPLGGTLDWAWMVMTAYVYLLTAIWLFQYSRGQRRNTEAFVQARPVFIILCCWLVWNLVQMVAIPVAWLAFIAPLSADIYLLANPALEYAPITLDMSATREELFKGSAYVLIFFLVLQIIDTPKRLQAFAWWLVIFATFQAMIASVATLTGSGIAYVEAYIPLEYQYQFAFSRGTFMNQNQLAGYLELNLAIGIGLLLAGMREGDGMSWREWFRHMATILISRKVMLRVFLALMVITLVLSRSRMGNAAFFISMFLTGALALLLMKRSPRPMVLLLTSLLIIDIFIVGTWFGIDKVQQRFMELRTETVVSDDGTKSSRINDGRIGMGSQSWVMHQDASLTGTGAGSFYAVFPGYQKNAYYGLLQHAHNDYLEFLTDTGWIGSSLLALAVLISLLTALRAMRRRNYPLMRGIAFSSTMGIISLMLHASADFNFRVPVNVALFMVILAMGFMAYSIPVKPERKGKKA